MKKLLLLLAVSSLVLAGYAAGNLDHVVYDNVATDYITVVDDVNESTDQVVPENVLWRDPISPPTTKPSRALSSCVPQARSTVVYRRNTII